MTLERKLLIAVGSLTVALIIAIGSFSLGMYIGQHGVLPGPPSVAGPGGPGPGPPPPPPAGPGGADQPPPVGPDGADRPPDLLPRRPDLVGPLLAADATSITIGTPPGPRLVRLEEDTQILGVDGQALSLDALEVGTPVGVVGHLTDDGRTMVAEVVVQLPRRD